MSKSTLFLVVVATLILGALIGVAVVQSGDTPAVDNVAQAPVASATPAG